MTLYPLQHRLGGLGRLPRLVPALAPGWGLVSCTCFVLNLVVVAKCLSILRGPPGLEAFVMMLVLVYVPPVLLAVGVLMGIAGVSKQRPMSAVMGVALNVLGAVGYLAWVGVGRA